MKPDDDMVAGFIYDRLENDGELDSDLTPPVGKSPRTIEHQPAPRDRWQQASREPLPGRSWKRVLFWILAALVLIIVLLLLNSGEG
jgi:hypothetical protein